MLTLGHSVNKTNYLSKSSFAFAQNLQLLSLRWNVKGPCESFVPFGGCIATHNLIINQIVRMKCIALKFQTEKTKQLFCNT